MKIFVPLICSIIGPLGGLLVLLVIDFLVYRREIKNRFCKDCLWYISKTETCFKRAHLAGFRWVWPHTSKHCTCDQFKYGKFNFYEMLFHKESEVTK